MVTDDRGTRIIHRFGAGTVGWDYAPGATDPLPAATGEDHYEAFHVAEGLVYAQFHHTDEPTEAVSLFLGFTTGHALSVITTIAEPAPTTALIGRRVL
ncbi:MULTISPECIES: MoaF N-terminal domain-containing protein [unclassified Amycolatopsis]|uniref:MoaF N-terminal domain-containing protein n=1 Tax=unclassified Amycolatopsis TaxID=2618356 RepID=UPI00287BA17B|nr:MULTISPECIES: MoaF N-terminal domain-containing protein [unclassified Amycolatopsis]